MTKNRREFLKASAMAAGGLGLLGLQKGNAMSSAGPLSDLPEHNMCNFSAPPIERVRVGIVGMGNRGTYALKRLCRFADVEIVAICDVESKMMQSLQRILAQYGKPPAKVLTGSEDAWEEMTQMDLDLMYITTPWQWHTPMCVGAMENGKHAAVEVPAATSLEECWHLVETSERTRKHCMMLENVCYGKIELQTLNMARQGVFGELTYGEGSYIHMLAMHMSTPGFYHEDWRLEYNKKHNGNLYPTHGLGPIAQCMNINRGNKFNFLVSMSSQEAAFSEWARSQNRDELVDLKGFRGDINTSLIQCASGANILVQHDVSTPRPYSRHHFLQGSKGMMRAYPSVSYCIDSDPMARIHKKMKDKKKIKKIEETYTHPLIKSIGETTKRIGGHGGMDALMDYRLIYCLKNGLPLDMDVYDAASWSSLFELTINSVSQGSMPVQVPDFTRGNWKSNAPLAPVDVDPKKLQLNLKSVDQEEQMEL